MAQLKQAVPDALNRLSHLAGSDPFERLSTMIDAAAELEPLRVALERLADANAKQRPPSRSRLEEARRKWETSRGHIDELTTRDIRALCSDPDIATEPAFVAAVCATGKLPSHRQWLERLIESYFAQWGAIADQGRLERVLRDAVWSFSGRSPEIVRCAQHRADVFSAQAPAWFAKQALQRHVTPDDVIAEWKIPASGRLARAVWNSAAEAWTTSFRFAVSHNQASVAECKYLRQGLLGSALLEPAVVGEALSEVILWDFTSQDEDVRGEFERFLLDDPRFGDPRLPANAGRWSAFASTAKARVIVWLSKRDLLFFFNLVIDHDPHHRRDFWLNYIDQVEDSNVALCFEDEAKLLRATSKEERGRYSRIVGSEGVSAFLMRFRGANSLVFVEFSETNNALFVHSRDRFDANAGGIRSASFRISSDLKLSKPVLKLSHQPNWRERARTFLAQHGIRRGQA